MEGGTDVDEDDEALLSNGIAGIDGITPGTVPGAEFVIHAGMVASVNMMKYDKLTKRKISTC